MLNPTTIPPRTGCRRNVKLRHFAPSRRFRSRRRILTALFVALLFGAGCDNSIEPLAPDEGGRFAIHGYLDMASDMQTIRVEGLRSAILADPVDLSDVRVTTTDESTGDVVEWTREDVILLNGSTASIYTAAFRPKAGRRYRLQVARPGEQGSEASTTLPSRPGLTITQPINLIQSVFLQDLPRSPNLLEVNYDVIIPDDNSATTVGIVYSNDDLGFNDRVDVRLGTDRFIVQNRLFRTREDPPLTLTQVGLDVRLPSVEWERAETPRNLTNAEGFFGSVGEFEFNWTLDEDIVIQMGYTDGQPE